MLIRKQLSHKLLHREASLLENARFSILAKHDVMVFECRRRSDRDTFFARRDLFSVSPVLDVFIERRTYHVKTQPTLSLRLEHDDIHNIDFPPLLALSISAKLEEKTYQSTYSCTTL